jgi:predicted Zn-dependent peptidase
MTDKTSEVLNGRARLHTVKTDAFKMTRFSINFITQKDERKTPLSKLMLSVMFRGSKKYPTVTCINKVLDEQYGAVVALRSSTVGDKKIHKISCKLLNDEFVFNGDSTDILERVMEIVSDILFSPLRDDNGKLLSAYVESEKRIAIDQINSKKNDPKAYASEQCSKKMFEGSPYALYEDEAKIIDSFTSADVTDNVSRFFEEAKIEFFYIGNKSHDSVKKLVQKYFPFSPDNSAEISYGESAFTGKGDNVKYSQEDAEVSQGRLVMGYRCGTVLADSGSYAMNVFNEIFGGSSVSKLFMNVREKKSLCYYCASTYDRYAGIILVDSGIQAKDADAAREEILKQLDALREGNFSDTELESARRCLIQRYNSA